MSDIHSRYFDEIIRRYFDETLFSEKFNDIWTKYMYFLIKNDESLENFKSHQEHQKKFNSESVYNRKYLKTKINLIREKSTRIFNIKKIPKGPQCVCLSVILTDSVY